MNEKLKFIYIYIGVQPKAKRQSLLTWTSDRLNIGILDGKEFSNERITGYRMMKSNIGRVEAKAMFVIINTPSTTLSRHIMRALFVLMTGCESSLSHIVQWVSVGT